MHHLVLFFLLVSSCSARNGLLGAEGLLARSVQTLNGVAMLDGIPLSRIPVKPSVAEVTSEAITQTGWTVRCDSFQPGNECAKALDGNFSTFWQTADNAPLPHSITIDMKKSSLVGSITIQPRQDGNNNGHIGQHTISLSEDGITFRSPVAVGTYGDDTKLKTTTFTPANARYVKIAALSEAGNRGPYTSVAEVNVYNGTALPPARATAGSWGLTVDFPLIPVSAAIEWSSGRLLVWSAYAPDRFTGSTGKQTVTAIYDPVTKIVTQRTITNVGHDMFCEGLSMDADGGIVAVGGNSDYGTSIYDSPSDTWTAGGNLNTPRGYQAQATLSDGRIFTIGASWSGGSSSTTPKNGEIYSKATNKWSKLPGCPVAPMLTSDPQDKSLGYIYRGDNHGWLFGWKNGYVFQAGPATAMNWYGTAGTGSHSAAGNRSTDPDSMCGNAVMYDAVGGKILTVGGAPAYVNTYGTANAHVITINAPNNKPTVATINPMAYPRAFHNSVILPNGQVLVTGGQHYAVGFTDQTPQLIPELWDPATQKFTPMAPLSVPRNYHSTAVLLPDGTVMNGGGGLCGTCATNHFDAQIFYPPYLYTSTGAPARRPVISTVSATSVKVGGTLKITTTSAAAVTGFALIRLSSTTHAVNTDQRRIALSPKTKIGNTFTVVVPGDSGVALPGYWYLFALTANGVPSVAKYVKVTIS